MVVIVAPEHAEACMKLLQQEGETVYRLGEMIERTSSGVMFEGSQF
jgi:phosphoribosylformylglycinamidine cyclo-ligase